MSKGRDDDSRQAVAGSEFEAYDPCAAFARGMVLVAGNQGGWSVVVITGTVGDGDDSAWTGAVRCTGSRERCLEWMSANG